MSTKERIIEESLKLFAVNGFESVSVRTIAAAVGVRDSALYKHFSSKQAIFDTIVEQSIERFKQQYTKVDIRHLNSDNLVDSCMMMFRYQTKDPWIQHFRQILIIEQFRNPKIAELYKKIFIDMPIAGQKSIFEELIQAKVMKDNDAYVMAMELYAPFFLFHTVKEEDETLERHLRKHVENFMSNNLNDTKE
ncbi:transcriptional regulator, TetR family [Anaerosporobacter mobilis DSM 15930]|jgi:AcrR family transcriptional regulator|uniref:Transcriptional regulator, TetR family n=1 Tax=Anaerosporobacter mobilis DSM 15930 TaxID=1120996 RepID=A0A1M7F6A3_9FIRM|nr:TetR/AcrR family transcriptional regulator [Anaerosporobacter mobilis]SHL99572.1 transcriptional regulator, TetR family [Anaerosporobacter mobilis DSM 15930]